MKTFEEFQTVATKVPLSLRNNLDRINFPVMGLQEEAGKIGSLFVQIGTKIEDANGNRSVRFPQHSRHCRHQVRVPKAAASQAHMLAERMAAFGKSA